MSKRLVLLAALGAVLFGEGATAQKRYVEEEEEDPSLAMNRAQGAGAGGDIFASDPAE